MLCVESYRELNNKLLAEISRQGFSVGSGSKDFHHTTDVLADQGFKEKKVARKILESVTRCRSIDPNMISFSREFLERMSLLFEKSFVQVSQIFPIKHVNAELHVVMANPFDRELVRTIEVLSGSTVIVYCGSSRNILGAIDALYVELPQRNLSDIETVTDLALRAVSELKNDVNEDVGVKALVVNPLVIILLRLILEDVLSKSISDLHFEMEKESFRIRVRQDGVLLSAWSFPRVLGEAIILRLKVLADLDLTMHGKPRDGRISHNLAMNRSMDIRLSLLFGVHGEKVVLRILDRGKDQLSLSDLNLESVALGRIEKAMHRPNGMILVTGPTGSGKTTTLYAILKELNVEGVNIATAEDPVEYELAGITQVNCSESVGTTFPEALKSFLRQDPDIVMVGEIRDSETADIATKAALTGHLMLSTLHTNDAAGAVIRLLNIGVPDYVLAAVNLTVIAQRLVRKICLNCKESFVPSPGDLSGLGLREEQTAAIKELYFGAGCDLCSGTGYRGRESVMEVLVMNLAMEKLIAGKAGISEIAKAAIDGGMKTMRVNAQEKLLNGVTTLEEVTRVTIDS